MFVMIAIHSRKAMVAFLVNEAGANPTILDVGRFKPVDKVLTVGLSVCLSVCLIDNIVPTLIYDKKFINE